MGPRPADIRIGASLLVLVLLVYTGLVYYTPPPPLLLDTAAAKETPPLAVHVCREILRVAPPWLPIPDRASFDHLIRGAEITRGGLGYYWTQTASALDARIWTVAFWTTVVAVPLYWFVLAICAVEVLVMIVHYVAIAVVGGDEGEEEEDEATTFSDVLLTTIRCACWAALSDRLFGGAQSLIIWGVMHIDLFSPYLAMGWLVCILLVLYIANTPVVRALYTAAAPPMGRLLAASVPIGMRGWGATLSRPAVTLGNTFYTALLRQRAEVAEAAQKLAELESYHRAPEPAML